MSIKYPPIKIEECPSGGFWVMQVSPISGDMNKVYIQGFTLDGYKAYIGGALIQDAFPNLSPDEREFILTGITTDEWDATFWEPDE